MRLTKKIKCLLCLLLVCALTILATLFDFKKFAEWVHAGCEILYIPHVSQESIVNTEHGLDENCTGPDVRPAYPGGPIPADLGSAEDRICFPTYMHTSGLAQTTTTARCRVFIEGDQWRLCAQTWGDNYDARVDCGARCMCWNPNGC